MLRTLIMLLLIATTLMAGAQNKRTPVKVMSYNIRYANKNDAEKGNGWEQHRREKIIDLINHYDPDLLGVQEALKHQIDYLLEELPGYAFIGVGRNEGKMEGEFSAILYKKERFEPLKQNTFWLSTTPEKPSKAWDAALPRIVTWGYFHDKENNSKFYYFNTHFDHIGQQARAESAKLIVQKIDEIAGNAPVILTGDINATPGAEPYEVLSSALKDAAEISQKPAYGPEGTFSGFDLKSDQDFPRIDYIFVDDIAVLSYETIADFNRNKFPSDHLPVMAVVLF
jgi:endonuclease/exonuclease/phosphatase family metal-dependent hydrolase